MIADRMEGRLLAGTAGSVGVTLAATPQFAGTVKPGPGFAALQALRPRPGTTFPRGRVIADNGGRDFFGTPVLRDRPPAVGAVER